MSKTIKALNACGTPNRGNIQPTVLVHGGAGSISDENVEVTIQGVKLAARAGYETLLQTGSVLDAVEKAVNALELNEHFNSGHGSVLNWDGKVEMDASIMGGTELNGGCVSLAQNIYHPVSLARVIMERTPHRYMAGEGAMKIAEQNGFIILPEGSLITPQAQKDLHDYKANLSATGGDRSLFGPPGTVGAVAIDACGNVAAATSTGGLTGKLPGRIGDSPVLGGGTYADNESGAISLTGHGETIMRYAAASRVLALLKSGNYTAQQAAEEVLNKMTQRFNNTAGLITVDRNGQLGIYFTTSRMSWAYQRGEEIHFGINEHQDEMEIVGEPRVPLI